MQSLPYKFIQAEGTECPPSIQCSKCGNPWDEPVELIPCSHVFCKVCIGDLWSCPQCHSGVDDKPPAHELLQTMANRAKVQCATCGWQGMRQSSRVHRCPPPRPVEQVEMVVGGGQGEGKQASPADDVAASDSTGVVMGTVITEPQTETCGLVPPLLPSPLATGQVGEPASSIQRGQVVPPVQHESAVPSMKTSAAVIRSASDPKNKKPWFDYNLKKAEYQGLKSDFERAALSTSIHARVGREAVVDILTKQGVKLKHPSQEISGLMELFNSDGTQNSACLTSVDTVSFEELLTWLRYSTATKVSSGERSRETKRQMEMEETEEEQSKERIGHYVHDQLNAPSVSELTGVPGGGGLPPISEFGLGGGGLGGDNGTNDLLAKYSLGGSAGGATY